MKRPNVSRKRQRRCDGDKCDIAGSSSMIRARPPNMLPVVVPA
eukprot:CAMPEP_0115225954 /NCGR_PEP_ID=MMETSP0270-20121206/30375_1 /TAXON_ID=71861 /ORGANISM="Scrippsiella trochoidea, Strain CCMP3099" /LENGTH=42 /DNA_ID= /DNA_START= /DNA_END= /DNA_ORIENTATION=